MASLFNFRSRYVFDQIAIFGGKELVHAHDQRFSKAFAYIHNRTKITGKEHQSPLLLLLEDHDISCSSTRRFGGHQVLTNVV